MCLAFHCFLNTLNPVYVLCSCRLAPFLHRELLLKFLLNQVGYFTPFNIEVFNYVWNQYTLMWFIRSLRTFIGTWSGSELVFLGLNVLIAVTISSGVIVLTRIHQVWYLLLTSIPPTPISPDLWFLCINDSKGVYSLNEFAINGVLISEFYFNYFVVTGCYLNYCIDKSFHLTALYFHNVLECCTF